MIICISALYAGVQASASTFSWGVNGHPNVQESYCDTSTGKQFDLVAGLGAHWYRTDWPEESVKRNPSFYDKLVDDAVRRGIHILPVIIPSVTRRIDLSPAQVRKSSAAFARSLSTRYRGKITHWELDNELDIFAMIHKGEKDRNGAVWNYGDANGDRPEQFEESRYRVVKAELQGLHEGIKAGDPKAMTIIDSAGWLHYGFFERLVREDRVPFDITGWHWYSEMGDMTKVLGSFNVLKQLKTYGKPIWITEIDRRGGSIGASGEKEQADYLTAVAAQLGKIPGVEAFFVYEILDEPYFGPDNLESHMGLVEVSKGPDGRWQPGRTKDGYNTLRAAIAGK
jgi:hypothetical protein